jgi:hypothetical protein
MKVRKITITVPDDLFNAINKAVGESLEGRQNMLRRYIILGLEDDGLETSVEQVHLLRKDAVDATS